LLQIPVEAVGVKKQSKPKARVLLVDDHAIVRDGLAQLIQREDDMVICGEAASAEEAIQAVTKCRPDVAIVDISLGGANGLELIKNLKAFAESVQILVLSMHDETHYAERALRAGARGYLMKRAGREQILDAVRKVLAGDIFVSDEINRTMLHQYLHGSGGKEASPITNLSDRELEILTLLGRGLGSKETAERLHLSQKTVDSHRTHMKEKLRLKSAPELIRFAFEWVSSQEFV
jgi:DNA-binding NarL/FixJ family response regulator